MSQQTQTVLLRGGLDLVSPTIAIPPGQVRAAINYAPDVAGYTLFGNYERFDGHPRPSDSNVSATIAARRAAISAVPGTGSVLGINIYDGHVYAFRDGVDGAAHMYVDSTSGWTEFTSFGTVLDFVTGGTAQFEEGETIVGGTSSASATIDRLVQRDGDWSLSTAEGYLVLSDVSGTFTAGETVTSTSGHGVVSGTSTVALYPGGRYECLNHNFYGPAKLARMYFANGQGTAFEYNGEWIAPIRTGIDQGAAEDIPYIYARDGSTIIGRGGDSLIGRLFADRPIHLAEFANHLWLGYRSGAVQFSGDGEPLDWRTLVGAGDIDFGDRVTGFIDVASTSLMIFGRTRTEYVTGWDVDSFDNKTISKKSGAIEWSQAIIDVPLFMDDAGVRRLTSTNAFGDWRMGTITQQIQPLVDAKREAGVEVTASAIVKSRDQYLLFFDDGSGLILYFGRKNPEAMPFLLPIVVRCACAGEIETDRGDRVFVGADDGYVYELFRGRSFDGSALKAYIAPVWNFEGAPNNNKRFHMVRYAVSSEEDIELGLSFSLDFANQGPTTEVTGDVDAGSPLVTTDYYADVDFTQIAEAEFRRSISGLGRNFSPVVVYQSAEKLPHTLQTMTVNFSLRNQIRG